MGAGYDRRTTSGSGLACDPSLQSCPLPDACDADASLWALMGNEALRAWRSASAAAPVEAARQPERSAPAASGALDAGAIDAKLQAEAFGHRARALKWREDHPEVDTVRALSAWRQANGGKAWKAWEAAGRRGPEPERETMSWELGQALTVLMEEPTLAAEGTDAATWHAAFWSLKCLQYAEAFRRHLPGDEPGAALPTQRRERDQAAWSEGARTFAAAHPEALSLPKEARHRLARDSWWSEHHPEIDEQVAREGLTGPEAEARRAHLAQRVALRGLLDAVDRLADGRALPASPPPPPFGAFRGLSLEELSNHLKERPQDLPLGAAIHVKIDWHQAVSYHAPDAGHHWVTYVGKGRFADSGHPNGAEGRRIDRYVSATLLKHFPGEGFRHLHNEAYATQGPKGWALKPAWALARVSQIYPP
jgi:hypothetical protein